MKVFQISGTTCVRDYSDRFESAEDAREQLNNSPAVQFIDAPDYVYDGWRFSEDENGNVTFLLPDGTAPTPAKLREQAYQRDKIIEYNNELITVDEASWLWLHYSAESNADKMAQLTLLIAEAKQRIRTLYPDEVQL